MVESQTELQVTTPKNLSFDGFDVLITLEEATRPAVNAWKLRPLS
ncbi:MULTISPECIES: hypothetical protein [Aerosakkonema]